METSFHERKKRSNIATGLLMHIAFKKLLAIHEREIFFFVVDGRETGPILVLFISISET